MKTAHSRLGSRRRPAMLAGLSALLAAICFSTSPARATLVEGSFDGFATGFGTYETFLHLNGSQMTGSFSYDTAAAVQTGTNTFTFTSGAEITIESGGLHEHAVATAALPITLRLGINFGISGGQAGVADGNPLDGFAPHGPSQQPQRREPDRAADRRPMAATPGPADRHLAGPRGRRCGRRLHASELRASRRARARHPRPSPRAAGDRPGPSCGFPGATPPIERRRRDNDARRMGRHDRRRSPGGLRLQGIDDAGPEPFLAQATTLQSRARFHAWRGSAPLG